MGIVGGRFITTSILLMGEIELQHILVYRCKYDVKTKCIVKPKLSALYFRLFYLSFRR